MNALLDSLAPGSSISSSANRLGLVPGYRIYRYSLAGGMTVRI